MFEITPVIIYTKFKLLSHSDYYLKLIRNVFKTLVNIVVAEFYLKMVKKIQAISYFYKKFNDVYNLFMSNEYISEFFLIY